MGKMTKMVCVVSLTGGHTCHFLFHRHLTCTLQHTIDLLASSKLSGEACRSDLFKTSSSKKIQDNHSVSACCLFGYLA